ncbi:BBSome-interacting protein 1 isoform X3 [Marmota flaviventris]|uniref:BBSome-interacting protein 1 isoform X3 n=1 Tax=Marmota flaviventris TaxID=93162 RepID=UPI003A8B44A1
MSPLPRATAERSGKGCFFPSVGFSQELRHLDITRLNAVTARKRPELSGKKRTVSNNSNMAELKSMFREVLPKQEKGMAEGAQEWSNLKWNTAWPRLQAKNTKVGKEVGNRNSPSST